MLYQITDGTVTVGGQLILSHINFEIRGNEKIAVVGRNGAGKTTLLKLIAGEYELDRDDKSAGAAIRFSRRLTVGMLKQQAFSRENNRTVEQELLESCPCRDTFDRERFLYEQEIRQAVHRLRIFKGGQEEASDLIFRRGADEDRSHPAAVGKAGYPAVG